jgi:Zn-dependent protease
MGIPISLDASWLIILALLTWTLFSLFEQTVPGMPSGNLWALSLGTALAFFACIVLHELGHALVAGTVGIPVRGITLFLFGGVAEMEEEPASAGREFLMAIAGPVVSAVLATLLFLASGLSETLAFVVPLRYLAVINLAILIFNLVPAFPLDGGRVLRSALWGALGDLRRATWLASLAGQAFAAVLIVLGLVRLFAGSFVDGIWLGLIGLFLNNAARSGYDQVLVRQALHGEPISRFMNPTPITVPPGLDLRHWVDDFVYHYHRKMFPVTSDGHVAGVISTAALHRFPRDEWARHTVAEAMEPDVDTVSIAPATDALEALGKMQRTGSSRLLVLDGDRLVGIVSLKDLLRFLNTKLELEGVNRGS